MKPRDLFRYGCTNLFRRKTRTALTALSMAVGVMCIVVLISVGLGYEQAYRESIEAMGSLTKIDVTPATSDYGRKALLNDKALEAFRGIDGVEAVTPVYQQSAYIVSGNYVNMVRVYGLSSGESGTVHVWYQPPTAWLIAQGASVLGALLLAASLRRMRRRA